MNDLDNIILQGDCVELKSKGVSMTIIGFSTLGFCDCIFFMENEFRELKGIPTECLNYKERNSLEIEPSKVGDVVQLKSGSILMTVVEIIGEKASCRCMYNTSNSFGTTKELPLSILKISNP